MRFLLKLGALLLALAPAAFAQNGAYGPSSGGSAIIDFAGVPSGVCSGDQQAKNLANGHLFQCFGGSWLEIGPGAAGAAAFNTITSGTAAGQAFHIGNGTTLDATGSGTINATAMSWAGLSAFPAGCGATLFAKTVAATLTCTQVAFSDLSGLLLAAQSPAYTGDVTSPAGSLALTIAATGSTAASCGDSTHTCAITFNTKGQATANSNVTITGAGTGIGSGTAHGIAIYNSNTTVTSMTPSTTNGLCTIVENVTAGVAVDPTCLLNGIPVNTPSTPYNQLFSDRGTLQRLTGGSTFSFNLMQITGNGASNYPFVLWNGNSGLTTLTANSADKINNGSLGGTFTILPKFLTLAYQDSSSAPGNWWPYNVATDLSFGADCGDSTHALKWSTTAGIGCQAVTGSGGTPSYPVTVAGTVNSGGIPAFCSTTSECSSALLPTGDFVLGGGAGAAPTATFSVVPVVNGGTGTGSTLAGLVRGNSSAMTAAELSGDCATSGSNAVTCTKVNGIAHSATQAAHTVEVVTTANATATAKVLPDCTDTGGNHINYTQSTDAFSCGTSGGAGGGLTSVGLTMPPAFGPVANTPLTANGTLAATYLNPNTNQTFDTNVPFIQLMNTRRSSSLVASGLVASSFSNSGDAATLTGTQSQIAPTASAPTMIGITTGSTINTSVGVATQTIHRTGRAHGLMMQVGQAMNVLNAGTNPVRLFIGISDQTRTVMNSSDVPAGNYAGFMFDDLSGGGVYTGLTNTTNYVCINKDNTTQKATSSGITADTAFHYFAIFEDIPNSSYHYYIDNVEVCGTGTTANIPTTGTNMAGMVTQQNLAATAVIAQTAWIQFVEDK